MATPTPTPFPVPDQDFLRTGDVLVFARNSPFNLIIKIKTWSHYSHVEAVQKIELAEEAKGLLDPIRMMASRNGEGVNMYMPDYSGLALVLRLKPFLDPGFNAATAYAWFRTVIGQKYDWLGLLNFYYARVVGRDNHKQFCSEFVCRYLRAGGFAIFRTCDADTISPRDFAISDDFDVIWAAPGEGAQRAAETQPPTTVK